MKLYSRSHPAHKARRDGIPTGHGPCGCQGSKGFKGSLRGSWLKRSKASKVLKVSKAQGLQGFKGKGFQGIKGTIFSLFQGHKGNHL